MFLHLFYLLGFNCNKLVNVQAISSDDLRYEAKSPKKKKISFLNTTQSCFMEMFKEFSGRP